MERGVGRVEVTEPEPGDGQRGVGLAEFVAGTDVAVDCDGSGRGVDRLVGVGEAEQLRAVGVQVGETEGATRGLVESGGFVEVAAGGFDVEREAGGEVA